MVARGDCGNVLGNGSIIPMAIEQEELPEQAVGRRIRTAREARGMSQQRLADSLTQLGRPLNQGQVGKTEAGRRPLRIDEAWLFARALGLTPYELLFDPGTSQQLAVIHEA